MSWLVGWMTSCFFPSENDMSERSITFDKRSERAPISSLMSSRSFPIDKRENQTYSSIDKKSLSLTSTKYNKRQLNNKLIMKDKCVDDDFIVFNFAKDDKGVHKYAIRPSLLKGEEKEDKLRISIESRGSIQSEDCEYDSFSFHVLDRECIENGLEVLDGEEKEGKLRISIESRASIQFEESNDSFSFPVLDRDWIGSPVRMPKPECQQHLKKHKTRCIRFLL